VHLTLAWEGADYSIFFKNRHGRFRESDASGDTARGSPSNHALVQLIGTNHGPSGCRCRELAGPAQETADQLLHLLTFNARDAPGNECRERDRHKTKLDSNHAHKVRL
jgi:hypothetical protein